MKKKKPSMLSDRVPPATHSEVTTEQKTEKDGYETIVGSLVPSVLRDWTGCALQCQTKITHMTN